MQIGKKITEELNLPKDKFFKMRRRYPEQLEFIQTMGETMIEAYPKYLAYKIEVEDEAGRIFVFLERRRQKLAFSEFLVKAGLYTSSTAYFKLENVLFSDDGVKKFSVLKKLEQANKLFDKFLEENPIRFG